MNLPILAVDKNIEISQNIQAEWQKRRIDTVRVDTMQEAIEKLIKESFLFVGINADNISCLPMLSIMAGMTPTPILINTSNFTVRDQTEALRNGADGYAPFHENINESIDSALALLQRLSERSKQPYKKPSEPVIYENIIISLPYRQAFYNDKEIKLTKTEFDLLHYFISNHGKVLSYRQIYRKVWGNEYQDLSHKNLWNHVFNVRKKLLKAAGCEYIETEINVGYRFIALKDK